MNREKEDKNFLSKIIIGLVALIVLMCVFVPGFFDAVYKVIMCSFYTCVQVQP